MTGWFGLLCAACWTPALLWFTPLGRVLADWFEVDDETPKWVRFMYYGPLP